MSECRSSEKRQLRDELQVSSRVLAENPRGSGLKPSTVLAFEISLYSEIIE